MGPVGGERLLGDFAIAVVGHSTSKVWLLRDAAGQRPLYYSVVGAKIAFASMPVCLKAFEIHLRPTLVQPARLISFADDETGTEFEDVFRLLAGTILRFDGASTTLRQWWQLSLGSAENQSDTIDQYKELLESAVRALLPANGPVTVHLSSGWDTSAVATTAAKLAGPRRLIAYTAAPIYGIDGEIMRDRFSDESSLAALTASRSGIRHEVVRDGPAPLDVARHYTALTQSLILNPFNGSYWQQIRRRAVLGSSNVILTGELGNLSLNAGGLSTLAVLIRKRKWLSWLKESRLSVRGGRVRWRGVLVNSFGDKLPNTIWQALHRKYQGFSFHDRPFLLPRWRIAKSTRQPSGDYQADMLSVLRNVDPGPWRAGGFAEGDDERGPFADCRLLEFALQLSPSSRIRDGVSRPLARAALSDRVPMEVLNHSARGLQSADWYMRISALDARNTLEEISAVPLVREFLDIKEMDKAIQHWPTENWNRPQVYDRYRVSLVSSLRAGIFIKQFGGPAT